jgi:uncharacterized membrane protein
MTGVRSPSSTDGNPSVEPAVTESGPHRSDGSEGSGRWAFAMWSLDSPDAADQVADLLAEDTQGVGVSTAAAAMWPALSMQPATRVLPELSQGVLGETFWTALFGALFFAPMVVAPAGRIGGVFAAAGIDDQFFNRARDRMVPGTSALFLLTRGQDVYRLVDAAAQYRPDVLVVELTADQKRTLEATFAAPR